MGGGVKGNRDEETIKEVGNNGRMKLSRRISVAPMMDWTDDRRMFLRIKYLGTWLRARLLYVSSSAKFAPISVAE